MKVFLIFLSFLSIAYQEQRKLIHIEQFQIENLDFNDIAFDAQEYYDSELDNLVLQNPYKFVSKDGEVIIELDDEVVGYIKVEKLLIDIKWMVQIEFQVRNKEFLYQVAYSVDSRVENMTDMESGWKDLVQEKTHTADLEPFFADDFEETTLQKITENFSSDTFTEQQFNSETKEIEDVEQPPEISCQSKSNPDAFFYMFVCHNKDFKIFEITFYKQNEDLVHISTYTPHQDNEYYFQHEKFQNQEEFDKIIQTSFDAVNEAKTYAKLNFDNYHEMVQAVLEDQSIDMFEFDGISELKEVCKFETNEIPINELKFYQIEIEDLNQKEKKERKLNIKNNKILRTEKFDKNLSQIKYFLSQDQEYRKLNDEKEVYCPLDECHIILGEIFMDSFHYYQIKIHCKQLTADHYISFQDPSQIYEKLQFIINRITKNIHQWKVINTELKDVVKEYHRINFYYSIAEKILKEHEKKVSVREQSDKVIFMNKERTENLFIISIHKDEKDDDVKVNIHFYYPPELRQTSQLRDELTVSANEHMKQEIYIEDALDDYLNTIKKDDSKKIVI